MLGIWRSVRTLAGPKIDPGFLFGKRLKYPIKCNYYILWDILLWDNRIILFLFRRNIPIHFVFVLGYQNYNNIHNMFWNKKLFMYLDTVRIYYHCENLPTLVIMISFTSHILHQCLWCLIFWRSKRSLRAVLLCASC